MGVREIRKYEHEGSQSSGLKRFTITDWGFLFPPGTTVTIKPSVPGWTGAAARAGAK